MATIRERTWRTSAGGERHAWIADFFDAQGVRRQKTFRLKKDADAWLVQARGQVAAGIYTPEATSATIGEAIDLWIERGEAEGLEPATIEGYRLHQRHILALIDPKLKLAKLSTARCEQLRDDLLKAHERPTARKLLVSFKSALRDTKRRGLIAGNPAAETIIGANGRHKRRIKAGVDFPLPSELEAMLATGNPKERALVALAARAGLRASELRGLRWSDVHLGAKPTVTVSQRADRRAMIGSPKSEASRRSIPLGEATARALREWRIAQAPGRTLVAGTASDRPDMLGNLQKRLLTPLCAKAGVPRYSWHALRHYAVSSWLASGIDPKTAQHWAGHGTLMLTLDTYGHMIPRPDDHARIEAAESALLG